MPKKGKRSQATKLRWEQCDKNAESQATVEASVDVSVTAAHLDANSDNGIDTALGQTTDKMPKKGKRSQATKLRWEQRDKNVESQAPVAASADFSVTAAHLDANSDNGIGRALGQTTDKMPKKGKRSQATKLRWEQRDKNVESQAPVAASADFSVTAAHLDANSDNGIGRALGMKNGALREIRKDDHGTHDHCRANESMCKTRRNYHGISNGTSHQRRNVDTSPMRDEKLICDMTAHSCEAAESQVLSHCLQASSAVAALVHDTPVEVTSAELDLVLDRGNELYMRTVSALKVQGKFQNALLATDEIPEFVNGLEKVSFNKVSINVWIFYVFIW
ncbi:uncharacterized protein LOC130927222 isoform X2 [Corythoichthys intestinalis]|uniref:uncharacterized protein LOC130927222 isoform X2 n=1 Tax=Corythoichthys intestinalis TaxID=161448 RepID=UPI0025A56C38|nr:uncharacterized protein LOC130927222 isoform X2 [Corythoichthys intestinalis]